MWFLLFIAGASANPDRVLGRVGESLRTRSYATVDGEGPVRGRWRRTSGDIVGDVFRGAAFEHYTRRQARTPLHSHWFNAAGLEIGTLTYTEGEPATFTVTAPALAPVDVSTWTEQSAAGLVLRAPTPEETTAEQTSWTVGGGRVEILFTPLEDPSSPEFAASLAATCGCRLIDRHTAWIDKKAGIRYLLDIPAPGAGERGEIWLIPHDDQLVGILAWWPLTDRAAHATLRAIVSTAHWESR